MKKSSANSIKSWAPEDRPREKMILKGRSSLSDAELLAILLRSGNSRESALDLAKHILRDSDNDLNELGKHSAERFMQYPGVGEAKAVSIVAALELGRRRRESKIKKVNAITSSRDVFEYMQSVLTDLQHEEFWALFLNVKNHILSRVLIGEGGTTQTVVDPKKVFRLAIEHNAVNILVCHNHPSGGIQPSQSDINLTRKLREGAKILDMSLIDHVILGNENYYSFADQGVLDH